MFGENIQYVSQAERNGGNKDSSLDIAIFQHSLEQEPAEYEFLGESYKCHGDNGKDLSRYRIL